ncbi:MAG: hypothetical protein R3Y08_06840 [Rikenellaceae bacterium]
MIMTKRILVLILSTLFSVFSLYAQTDVEREAERANRGLTSLDNIFIPKGQWAIGGSASYSTHTNEDYSLVIVDDISSIGYSVDASTMFSYAFANNNSVGARIAYSRNLLKVDSSNVAFGEEASGGVNLAMDNCYLLSHSFSAMAILRQYIPLGNNKRFALFNEVQLLGGGSQSKYSYDSPVQGTYSTSRDFALNFAPGVTTFINNKIALEINVGAMGLSYSKTTQLHNQVESGESITNMFNFKINILSLGFGVTYYL